MLTKSQKIRTFRQFHVQRVFPAFGLIVLGQLHTETPYLHTDCGVQVRIEISRPAKDFGRDLILLHMLSGMVECVLSQISQQLAKGFGAVKYSAVHELFYLPEALFSFCNRLEECHSHVTEGNKLVISLQDHYLR